MSLFVPVNDDRGLQLQLVVKKEMPSTVVGSEVIAHSASLSGLNICSVISKGSLLATENKPKWISSEALYKCARGSQFNN